MRKRLVIAIVIGGLAIATIWLCEQDPFQVFSTEPQYEGHSLSCWMEHLYLENFGSSPIENVESRVALEKMGTNALPYLVRWIIKPLRSSSDFNYSSPALRGFEILGPLASPAIPDLVKNIGRNGNCPAIALARIGTNAIPALTEKLLESVTTTNKSNTHPRLYFADGKPKPELSVQRNIISALSYMGTNAEAAIPALIVYLRSNRARNPSEAAQALALVGHNQHNVVVPVLIESFGASRNYARACAADALGSFGANAISAIPILVSAQNDPDAEARTHVAIAMKQIAPETPDALAPLIQNLVHRESRVRSQALWALSRLGTNGVEALPALAGCLHDQVAQLRVEAEQCVQGVGLLDDEIVAGLKENLTNANHFVSAGAVSALGKFAGGSREAFMALIGGMNSRETEVTQQSKYQLIDAARISPNYLVVALEDSDPMVRYRALSILYDIARPVPESVPALVKLVQDTNAYVSSLAADVLWFQDRDAAKRLGIKHP